MAIDTAKITEASKALTAANRTLDRVTKNAIKVVASATARAEKRVAKKVTDAKAAIAAAELALTNAAQGK